MPAGFAFLQVYKLKPHGPQPLPALVRMLQHPHKQLGTINIVYHTSFIVPLMYKPLKREAFFISYSNQYSIVETTLTFLSICADSEAPTVSSDGRMEKTP